VRVPPSLRGNLVVRSAGLVAGLALCGAGIVGFYEARIGLPPWDVLHQGVAKVTPLSFGLANVAVGLAVLLLAWSLGARVGPGTVANAVLVGLFVAGFEHVGWVQALSDSALAPRIALMVAGLAAFSAGSAFYIGAAMGAGPRDSLMLVGSRRTGIRIALVRMAIEGAALLAGFLLGGAVGVGTLVFAALIGPGVEASFWALARTPLARPPGAPVPQFEAAR
jgi:uncharacterized membrane protein YczE